MVSREEAERRRGFDPKVPPADRARNRSLFFDDLLEANPPSPRLLRTSRHLHPSSHGNRDFLFPPIVLHSLYDQNDYPSRTAA